MYICDPELSYRDLDLAKDRKTLAQYNRKLQRPKIRYKHSEADQSRVVAVSTASFARFCIATELLQKYSYDQIVELADTEPVKESLETYLSRAKKVRGKKLSAYVGDEFTAALKKIYPDLDTDDLYKYTPELFYEGIRITDYKGDLIGVYGGRK